MQNLPQATTHQNQSPRCAKGQVTQANRCAHPRLANTTAKRIRHAARLQPWQAKALTANRCANAREHDRAVNTHKCDGDPTVAFFISTFALLTPLTTRLLIPLSTERIMSNATHADDLGKWDPSIRKFLISFALLTLNYLFMRVVMDWF